MTMHLPQLYHWAPVERRLEIFSHGLRTYSKPTVQSGRLRSPYICLGFSPSGAWALSGDFMRDVKKHDPYEEWDLWQIGQLPEMAHVEIRPEFGPSVQEVKVFTTIPASHLWHVGTRTDPVFIEHPEDQKGSPRNKKKR